ncbi:hypothetical protein, partial [Membranihabitans maritimus]|uniref:hypothetical protein n=1 Tax=Membranihabitans maritimus TaxID=2904244 RepID=UPI001F2DB439
LKLQFYEKQSSRSKILRFCHFFGLRPRLLPSVSGLPASDFVLYFYSGSTIYNPVIPGVSRFPCAWTVPEASSVDTSVHVNTWQTPVPDLFQKRSQVFSTLTGFWEFTKLAACNLRA